MHNNYEILELFPTPVLATVLPENLGQIVPWFYQQELDKNEGGDPANYGEHSQNTYLLDEPECLDLKNYILKLVKEFGDSLGFVYDDYKFGQSWLSFKYPGQHHVVHTHPNSLISGVFYFGEHTPNTSGIIFHKLGINPMSYNLLPKLIKDKRNTKYAQTTFSIETSPGLLVLFPSYLQHSVPLNETDKVRCSLAFNVVPSKGFGEEETLTELKF